MKGGHLKQDVWWELWTPLTIEAIELDHQLRIMNIGVSKKLNG